MNKQLEEAIKHLELHSEYNGIVDKGQCIRIPEKNFTKTKEAIKTALKELERLQEDYISKDKIREKIKEQKELMEKYRKLKEYGQVDIRLYKIQILEELLEGK